VLFNVPDKRKMKKVVETVLPHAKRRESCYTQEPECVSARPAGTHGLTTKDSVSISGSAISPSRCCPCWMSAERRRSSVAVVQAAVSCCSQSRRSSLRRPSRPFDARRCRRRRPQLTLISLRLQ